MARPRRAKKENKAGMIIVTMVLLALAGGIFVRYRYLQKQYDEKELVISRLNEDLEHEEARTQKLQQQEAYQQTDAFVEETARKLLNLIRPGDTTIKPSDE